MTGTPDDVSAWFRKRVPDGWFLAPVEVVVDREEIQVTGSLVDGDEAPSSAVLAEVKRFREQTRELRMALAHEAEHRFGRKVSWAVRCGREQFTFTHLAVPVMTRLRLQERVVLDTLIDAGVARSRSEALAWCVRLVGRNEAEWIDQLRQALVAVEEARAAGPDR
ncbi:MAG: hypothetical protein M3P97_08980 [Actinomycetota bacterium]|jgi:hypothetical protein|nr:hypothetical protein [Actinomycetota bacterium]